MTAKTTSRDEATIAQRFVCHIAPVIAALEVITDELDYDFNEDDSMQKIAEFKGWLSSNLSIHQSMLDAAPCLHAYLPKDTVAAAEARLAQVKNEMFLHNLAIENLARIHGIRGELLMSRGFSLFEISWILPEEDIEYRPHFAARNQLKTEQEKIEQFIASGANDFALLEGVQLQHFSLSQADLSQPAG
ncbi:hypothetical protein [Methylomonas rosea]|uniref:Uncharacterized protein n=1 Tax=Methylomonas rosea TaxID=2952227 RepID=A0ABT1TYG7_9GAMM|nr:hypothetical protein [Methylomonas sp. WSC-7]MCQ8119826.1 hypothetical protein [Methylomonas sp. WSC-7]